MKIKKFYSTVEEMMADYNAFDAKVGSKLRWENGEPEWIEKENRYVWSVTWIFDD